MKPEVLDVIDRSTKQLEAELRELKVSVWVSGCMTKCVHECVCVSGWLGV